MNLTRRNLRALMMRADDLSVMPGKYCKRVREIFRFAADAAQRQLKELRNDENERREAQGL